MVTWYATNPGADETGLRNYLGANLDEPERIVVMDPEVPVEDVGVGGSLSSR
jgi:hypothetical protein